MYASLEGSVAETGSQSVVLTVGGIGYRIYTTLETAASLTLNEQARLYTHLVVRETVLDLYGFLSEHERDFFEMLIGISGIGPKSGLAILSIADVATIKRAVSEGDTSYLTRVSGIGKKNAQKIVLELRDKLGATDLTNENLSLKDEAEALDALQALGYTQREARDALREVPKETTDAAARIKEALKLLGK